jgi:tetratricopeptide (TPR) repeat protein
MYFGSTGLARQYIREEIELLLLGEPERLEGIMNSAEMAELISLVGGHPLAAKLLASFLKVKTPNQLRAEAEWHHFELKLARYVLQTTDDLLLSEADKLLLQVLAAVREPMLVEDLLACQELASVGVEEVHQARSKLVDLFLIEQTGELMALHPFLYTYFEDQLKEMPERRDGIAADIGLYALNKALTLNGKLSSIYTDRSRRDSPESVRASNDVLRYAVPAGRLLRSVGKDSLAEELPIQIKGTLRDMVFFFYQEKRDYRKALEYAERWLAISPHDVEIRLQSARCYRNFRNNGSLLKAEEILEGLESFPGSRYLTARIYREKAMVREFLGDRQGAKELYNKGIAVDLTYPYIENYVGLANLLLKEADELPEYSGKRQALVRRALEFLQEARKNQLPLFDRLHLGTYAEALIDAGQEDVALPLLKDALRNRPRDGRLNYRMAEILRKDEEYDKAIDYAIASGKYGHPKAPIAIANIIYEQAQLLFGKGKVQSGNEKLREALVVLANFTPEYGSDQEVADTISAKIYRALGEYDTACEFVEGYANTSNPYTIYEQCRLDLLKAEVAELPGPEHGLAIAKAKQKVVDKIKKYHQEHKLPEPLQHLFNDLEK